MSAAVSDRRPFDLCGELPVGTTVLEASAGTGKTYTIAALAARYVAEGRVELAQLICVTFGRMATNELRLRVRERLVSVERQLSHAVCGQSPPADLDEVERLLVTGPLPELARRHSRIVRALADFDTATIATTHEFCLRMLDELGVLGGREPDAVFVEDLSALLTELTSDIYLRRYASRDLPPPMTYDEAVRIARDTVDSPHAQLVPAVSQQSEGSAAERVAFAAEVRLEVEHRKLVGQMFTYNDMLTRLRDALADPISGEAAAGRLRSRYHIVLVDEFQDTDPVQWDILRRAFHGHATLTLIGDPKQAIYAFRGADVFSYLDAVEEARSVATLSTNWRTDRTLVETLGQLIGGVALGDQRIVVRPVEAHHQRRRLAAVGDNDRLTAPVRIRIRAYDREAERTPTVGVLRPQIARDLVADVTALLASGLEISTDGPPRAVSPADIAVLVRKNERAESLREALVSAGVPAVVLGASSVYASSMAAQWLTLLVALDQPRASFVRQAALTAFFGWDFGRLAGADDEAVTWLSQRIRWWGRVLRSSGVAALLETIVADTQVTERLLSQLGGERQLTDLRHVAQSLHAAMVAGQLGVNALVELLRERIAQAHAASPDEGMRRLETDAASVQILTVHRSKGLEFPIVYLPEAWDRHVGSKDEGASLRVHDGSHSVLDVGGVAGAGRGERLARCRQEEDAEDLRLLYVALTRAQCQVITWWMPSVNTPASALQRFLYGAHREGVEPDPLYPLTGDPTECTQLGSGFSLERLEDRAPVPWQPPASSAGPLTARVFERTLDLEWRRTSYSALTAAVHGVDLSGASVDSEADSVKDEDESELAAVVPTAPTLSEEHAPLDMATFDAASPMQDLPSGAEFGTVVHAILESVELGANDPAAELRRVTATQLARSQPGVMTVDGLSEGLLPSLLTPLGPLAAGRALCDFAERDRLSELNFELPLAGGEVITADVRLGQLSPLLRSYLPASDPLRAYPDLLEHPALAEQTLRGYLTGSIDAVLRVRNDVGDPRYLVVDYKTNWLGGFNDEPLTVGHYTPPRLAEAMMQAHYPLQALLYSVAVHRFLRWRQPYYEPDVHLGGVLYLFLRGMAGPKTPVVDGVPCGVFSWRPPAELIVDLSDLLEGQR